MHWCNGLFVILSATLIVTSSASLVSLLVSSQQGMQPNNRDLCSVNWVVGASILPLRYPEIEDASPSEEVFWAALHESDAAKHIGR
jgi:hypothetical protein